jgi:hypothetical protein
MRHWRYKYENGYGASIIEQRGSGGKRFELAVCDHADKIIYDTPITSDVLSWLTLDDVDKTLKAIKALPRRDTKLYLRR